MSLTQLSLAGNYLNYSRPGGEFGISDIPAGEGGKTADLFCYSVGTGFRVKFFARALRRHSLYYRRVRGGFRARDGLLDFLMHAMRCSIIIA